MAFAGALYPFAGALYPFAGTLYPFTFTSALDLLAFAGGQYLKAYFKCSIFDSTHTTDLQLQNTRICRIPLIGDIIIL